MGKGIEDLAIPIAALGAVALTGGAAAPALGAAGAAGAAGAGGAASALGATGAAGFAGNALAAQGAAGLLGGAGATAAGYGGATAGLGSLAANSAASALPDGLATYGPNNEFIGSTIANDGMTANSFGGYDQLNGLERFGQRFSGMDFGGNGLKTAQKGLGMMQGQGQQPQAQQQAPAGAIQPRPQQQTGSFLDSSNIASLEEEEMRKRQWLMGLGSPNA